MTETSSRRHMVLICLLIVSLPCHLDSAATIATPGDTAIITTIITTTQGFELILLAHLHASATGDNKNKPNPHSQDPDQDLRVQRSIICVVIEIRVKIIISHSGAIIVRRSKKNNSDDP